MKMLDENTWIEPVVIDGVAQDYIYKYDPKTKSAYCGRYYEFSKIPAPDYKGSDGVLKYKITNENA